MVNSPLIRPAISWRVPRGIGGVPLGSHESSTRTYIESTPQVSHTECPTVAGGVCSGCPERLPRIFFCPEKTPHGICQSSKFFFKSHFFFGIATKKVVFFSFCFAFWIFTPNYLGKMDPIVTWSIFLLWCPFKHLSSLFHHIYTQQT